MMKSAAGLCLGTSLLAQQAAFIQTPSPLTTAAMVEDDEGALWLAGEEGVSRFDGTRFRRIEIGLGSKEHISRSIAKAADGTIWVTSLGGLFRIRNQGAGAFEVSLQRPGFGIGVAIHGDLIAHVEGDGHGGKLAVGRYRNGKLAMFRHESVYFNGPPRFTRDGGLTGACGDNICRFPAREVERAAEGHTPQAERFPLSVKGFGRMTALEDETGCVWVRASFRAAYRCPGDRSFTLLPLDLAEVTQFESLTLGPGNQIWLVSDTGLLTYGRPGRFRSLTNGTGAPRMVESVYHARDGTIWLGGVGYLWRLIPPERLELWTDRDGVTQQPLAVGRGGDGSMLIGGSPGLLRLNRERARWEPFGDQKEMRYVRSLYPLPGGRTLVGSVYSGVLELDRDGRILRAAKPSATRFGPSGSPTQVWTSGLATRLLDVGPGGLRFLPEPAGVAYRSANNFVRDSRGDVWHCVAEGVARRSAVSGEWRTYTQRDGLLHAACRAVEASPSGDEVWVVYQVDAMSRLDFSGSGAPRVTNYQNGTGRHFATFVDFDRRGWLWRGGMGIHAAAEGRADLENWITFNELDGFPVREPDVGRYLYHDDADGSVWIASEQAVRRYVPPADLFTRPRAARAFLSSAPRAPVEAGQPAVFEFGSLYFELRNQLRFRYRLNPGAPWTETTETTKSFPGLRPESYRFELSARVAPAGAWSPPVSHVFEVRAPFWQSSTLWVPVGSLGLGGVGVAWAVRRRRQSAYDRQKRAFLDALDRPGSPVDPETGRLLELARVPTHLPDLAPLQGALEAGSRAGTVIGGRFTLEAPVASGGFATVHRAADAQRASAASAVKIFQTGLAEREWMLKRFAHEIEALRRIEHPNVVRFLDAGQTDCGDPYLAMDYVDGRTLRHRLSAGPVSRREVADLARQLGSALAAIHAAGVFHRDIKPENLMLAPGGRLVVIDFSIAIARDPRATQHALSRAAGSLLYMAPEQVYGFATPATDVYSFALVVFEMLTGQRAGDLGLGAGSGSLPADAQRVLAERCPDLPPADVLAAGLHPEVRQRPADVLQFARRLAEWIES